MNFDMSSFLQGFLVVFSASTAILTYQALYKPNGSGYFDDSKTRESFVFIISILTIFVTQCKSCTDKNNAEAQKKIYDSTLAKREEKYNHKVDSISTNFIDSLKGSANNTTEILAKYGYKVDSLHNIIIKDTGRKVVNYNYGEKSKLTVYADSSVTFGGYVNNAYKFSIGFISTGSYCDSLNINVQTVYVWNGQYFKVPGKHQVLGSTDFITKTPIYAPFALTNIPNDVSRFFFYLSGTYNHKEPFEYVVTYNTISNTSGAAVPEITNEIIHLIKD